jgi:hypothetical protein
VQVLRQEGPAALFIGLAPTLYRNTIWNGWAGGGRREGAGQRGGARHLAGRSPDAPIPPAARPQDLLWHHIRNRPVGGGPGGGSRDGGRQGRDALRECTPTAAAALTSIAPPRTARSSRSPAPGSTRGGSWRSAPASASSPPASTRPSTSSSRGGGGLGPLGLGRWGRPRDGAGLEGLGAPGRRRPHCTRPTSSHTQAEPHSSLRHALRTPTPNPSPRPPTSQVPVPAARPAQVHPGVPRPHHHRAGGGAQRALQGVGVCGGWGGWGLGGWGMQGWGRGLGVGEGPSALYKGWMGGALREGVGGSRAGREAAAAARGQPPAPAPLGGTCRHPASTPPRPAPARHPPPAGQVHPQGAAPGARPVGGAADLPGDPQADGRRALGAGRPGGGRRGGAHRRLTRRAPGAASRRARGLGPRGLPSPSRRPSLPPPRAPDGLLACRKACPAAPVYRGWFTGGPASLCGGAGVHRRPGPAGGGGGGGGGARRAGWAAPRRAAPRTPVPVPCPCGRRAAPAGQLAPLPRPRRPALQFPAIQRPGPPSHPGFSVPGMGLGAGTRGPSRHGGGACRAPSGSRQTGECAWRRTCAGASLPAPRHFTATSPAGC